MCNKQQTTSISINLSSVFFTNVSFKNQTCFGTSEVEAKINGLAGVCSVCEEEVAFGSSGQNACNHGRGFDSPPLYNFTSTHDSMTRTCVTMKCRATIYVCVMLQQQVP